MSSSKLTPTSPLNRPVSLLERFGNQLLRLVGQIDDGGPDASRNFFETHRNENVGLAAATGGGPMSDNARDEWEGLGKDGESAPLNFGDIYDDFEPDPPCNSDYKSSPLMTGDSGINLLAPNDNEMSLSPDNGDRPDPAAFKKLFDDCDDLANPLPYTPPIPM